MLGNLEQIANDLEKNFDLDRRFVVAEFRINAKVNGIEFVTSSSYAGQRAEKMFLKYRSSLTRKEADSVSFTIHLLPDKSVGDYLFGLSNVGTAAVRSQPTPVSEIKTEVLLGESFDVLEILPEGWVRVRLHGDGYIGWVSSSQVKLLTPGEFQAWGSLPKAQIKEKIVFLRSKPSERSEAVRDAVIGVRLPVGAARGAWRELLLPDGERAWGKNEWLGLVQSYSRSRSGIAEPRAVSSLSIIRTALSFLGVSYLWGGRSPKGFDCSGFVQTVFHLNGIELPRDANLQWRAGKFIGKDFKKIREGDLVFFRRHQWQGEGNGITHVGIALGEEKDIIHASGFVRISSLDPRSQRYEERLAKTFAGARRLVTTNSA